MTLALVPHSASTLATASTAFSALSLVLSQNNATALSFSGASAGLTIGSDTNLYRQSANLLVTDDVFRTYSNTGTPSFFQFYADQFQYYFGSDTQPKFQWDYANGIRFGPGGSSGLDTNLYRSAAGTLKTDGDLHVAGRTGHGITPSGNGMLALPTGATPAVNGIIWNGGDVNLYRSAAARLDTDHLFEALTLGLATKQKAGTPVDGDWAVAPPNGTLVVDSTSSKIWARVGGVWKGVVIA